MTRSALLDQAAERRPARDVVPLSFATFWAGSRMPALDRACLASFAQGGHPVTLYSFDEVADLPDGIALRDAREIAPRESVDAFIHGGRPNLSHFSDYFRYRLFERTHHAWIDTDMLLLRPIDVGPTSSLFAKETERSVCGAIMRIATDHPQLPQLIGRTEKLMHTELVWGATGPRLLNHVLGAANVLGSAYAPHVFFPIHFDAFWKPFLPEYAEECADACRHAYTLHLWNNIVVSLGVWKEMAPPEGSFLWTCLRDKDLLSLFRDVYPAEVMRNMVANWRLRKSGGDIGVMKLARQILPSILRTAKPRLRALRQMRG